MTTSSLSPASSLADVLPAAAASLGVTWGPAPLLTFPQARVVVVLLIDGLGEQLLAERGGHAPFMRQLRAEGTPSVTSGFPSTTATSMGMLGTGLPPGGHGLVGLSVLDPDQDLLFNELTWDPSVDPHRWQPETTVFERVERAGLSSIRIGPDFFDGSGLTEAALRGGRFIGAGTWKQRAQAAIEAANSIESGLIYVYWGEVDKAGHVYGCQSWRWADELTEADHLTRTIAEGMPDGGLLVVTADHGMVDVPMNERIDLAHDAELAAGIRHVGGEPRALQLYCKPGATGDVIDTWTQRLAGRMSVHSRDEVIKAGWFGPVSPRVLPRIGDVIVSAVGDFAVVDSRTARPESLRLIGQHGARTPAEQLVPLMLAGPATRS